MEDSVGQIFGKFSWRWMVYEITLNRKEEKALLRVQEKVGAVTP